MVKEVFSIGPSKEAIAIRTEVFVVEQGFENEIDEFDKNSISLVLFLDDKPMSTGRLVKINPEIYKIGRVAVKKEFRGNHVGIYTLKYLCNKAIQLGARKVILDSQFDKTGFYKKAGFKIVSEEPFLEEGVKHVKMEKYLLKKKIRRY